MTQDHFLLLQRRCRDMAMFLENNNATIKGIAEPSAKQLHIGYSVETAIEALSRIDNEIAALGDAK